MRVALVSVAFAASMVGGSVAASLGWSGQPDIVNKAGKPAVCLPMGARKPFPISRLPAAESFAPDSANWVLIPEPGSLPWLLSPSECVVFGEKLPGYAEDEESALVRLDRNFTYVFMIDRVSDSGHHNFFYLVVFCVGAPSAEAVEDVQHRRDSAGRVFVPYCDAALNGNSR